VNVPFQELKAKDGDIIITVNRDVAFATLCKILGCEEMIDDPKFATSEARRQNRIECIAIIQEKVGQWEVDALDKVLNEAGIPSATINTIDKVVNDPQIIARNMIVEVDHPTAGKYKLPNSPFKFSKTPAVVEHGAPILGESNRAVFKEIGLTDAQIDELLVEQAKIRQMFPEFAMK
jgi:crotonobetainyl-CoA:carnitine CoA-transferase CaiB-like acyl-CoA transferase